MTTMKSRVDMQHGDLAICRKAMGGFFPGGLYNFCRNKNGTVVVFSSRPEGDLILSEAEFYKCFIVRYSDNYAKEDPVSPSHYKGKGGMELMDVVEAFFTHEELVGALKFNVLKYTVRFEKKNGVVDLKKAKFYLDKLIKSEEGDTSDKEG